MVHMTKSSTKPWYKSPLWIVIMAVVIIVWMVGVGVIFDKADSAPADQQGRTTMRCGDMPGAPCPSMPGGTSAKKYKKKFNAGNYHNSKGQVFPKRIKKKIRHWYNNHPNAKSRMLARSDGGWWKFPFEQLACSPSFGVAYKANCERGNAHKKIWDGYVHEVTKVTVSCGGAAVFGSLRNGGVKGAGIGAGACLWATFINLMP